MSGLVALDPATVAATLRERFPGAVEGTAGEAVYLRAADWAEVAAYLRSDEQFSFEMLVDLTAVDYIDYFEVVARLMSLQKHATLVIKTRAYDRESPEVPSLVPVWRGANYLEREVYDLFGVRFAGHPNLKRIMLWDEFEGHPLRKDFFYENIPPIFDSHGLGIGVYDVKKEP